MNRFEVLYEDKDFLIVNKAPGVPVAPDKSGDRPLVEDVTEYVEKTKPGSGKGIGLPHRIDRPTSGIVIFTKNVTALSAIGKAWIGKSVRKTYWAAVDNSPPASSGTLVHLVSFDPVKNKAVARDLPGPDSGARMFGKKAVLTYSLIGHTDRFCILELELETGRHHQIRAQLAKIGLHIKGDVKYGFSRTNPGGGIHLHARSVSFDHPLTGNHLVITASPPDDPVWNAASAL